MKRTLAALLMLAVMACTDLVPGPLPPDPPRDLATLKHEACTRWFLATGVPACELVEDVEVQYGNCTSSVWGCYWPSIRTVFIVPGNGDTDEAVMAHELGHAMTLNHTRPNLGIMAPNAWPPCLSNSDISEMCAHHSCTVWLPECM